VARVRAAQRWYVGCTYFEDAMTLRYTHKDSRKDGPQPLKDQEAEPHRKAAEYYEASARSHRRAAEAHERGDQDAADHHSSEAVHQHQDGERHEERARRHHPHPPE
jgi:hypothetical protein